MDRISQTRRIVAINNIDYLLRIAQRASEIDKEKQEGSLYQRLKKRIASYK